MNMLQFAAELFTSKTGSEGPDITRAMSGLGKLLPTDSKGDVDLGLLVSKFASNGALASLVNSWLGNGQNNSISADQVMGLFGQSKVENFSQEVNMDSQQAAQSLSQMIPELIDKNSEGGSLLSEQKQGLGKRIMEGLFG